LISEYSEEIKLDAVCDAELESEDLSLDEIVNSTLSGHRAQVY